MNIYRNTKSAAQGAVTQIKHRYTDVVLFEHTPTDEQQSSGIAMRVAIGAACKAGADLGGAYLRDADLRDADLRDADLRGADLGGADLGGADLRGADLRGADLRDADLRGADLGGADLRDADLRGADLGGADLGGADLGGADRAADEQAIANLDKVREIILDNTARLEMNHWHQTDEWRARTCAEETLCETTHCLAGWLQVCSTDEKVRAIPDPQLAGVVSAPVAAKMFFRQADEVLSWLDQRKYVAEIEDGNRRAAERKAKRDAEDAQ